MKGARPTAPLATGLLERTAARDRRKKGTSRDTRLALLERLQELGSPDQAGDLVPLLRDFDIQVAQSAAATIQQWNGRSPEIDPQVLTRPTIAADALASPPPARVKMRSGKVFVIDLRPDARAAHGRSRFARLARDRYYDGLSFIASWQISSFRAAVPRRTRIREIRSTCAMKSAVCRTYARSGRPVDARPRHRRRAVLRQSRR